MKLQTLPALKKALAGDEGPSVFLSLAKESFDREAAVEMVLDGSAAEVLLAERLSPSQLADELNTRSLFSDHRYLHVKGVDRLPATAVEELVRYCSAPAPYLTLLLTAPSLRSNSALYRAVEGEGWVLDIASLKPWEVERLLAEWLIGEAVREEKSLSLETAQELVRRAGKDKGLLRQELNKLVAYVGKGITIEREAVELLSVGIPTEAFWELGKAVLGRQPCRAMAVWRDLSEQGMAALPLLAALRSQFHTALTLTSIAARGGSRHEMAEALPNLREKALYRNLQEGQKYGERRLRHALLALADLELKLKNKNVPKETLLDVLILRLAA